MGWKWSWTCCCISFDSYIKPQPSLDEDNTHVRCISFDSYIKPQLKLIEIRVTFCCISFDSYIKPQLGRRPGWRCPGCISFDSYIKPQLLCLLVWNTKVVYLLIPTSNHNNCEVKLSIGMLYIFWFLHQTTTNNQVDNTHQCCISFDSYIKPQHYCFIIFVHGVVYLLIPTSNHNQEEDDKERGRVVYLLIPTSNHNIIAGVKYHGTLYIFWFLHQTTTARMHTLVGTRCISFDSYIKPQLEH